MSLVLSFLMFFTFWVFAEIFFSQSQNTESFFSSLRRKKEQGDYYNFFWFLVSFTAWNKFILSIFTLGVPLIIYPMIKTRLGFSLLESISNSGIRVLLALLIIDFLSFIRHYISHQVEALWAFHKIHHSPSVLNIMLHWREHPFLMVFKKLAVLPIVALLGLSSQEFALAFLLRELWFLTHHSSIDLKIGPLKYVLVTPQYHRIHHLIQENGYRHQNLGNLFTFWDILFGISNFNFDKVGYEYGLKSGEYKDASAKELILRPYRDSFEALVKGGN